MLTLQGGPEAERGSYLTHLLPVHGQYAFPLCYNPQPHPQVAIFRVGTPRCGPNHRLSEESWPGGEGNHPLNYARVAHTAAPARTSPDPDSLTAGRGPDGWTDGQPPSSKYLYLSTTQDSKGTKSNSSITLPTSNSHLGIQDSG